MSAAHGSHTDVSCGEVSAFALEAHSHLPFVWYCMAPHVSDKLRACIVSWKYDHNLSAHDIAQLAQCSERTVYEILQVYRECEELRDPYARTRGRPRVLETSNINYILSLLAADPTLYLDEIQDRLINNRGVDVSIATVARAIRRMNITNKAVAREAFRL